MEYLKKTDLKRMRIEQSEREGSALVTYAAIASLNEEVLNLKEQIGGEK